MPKTFHKSVKIDLNAGFMMIGQKRYQQTTEEYRPPFTVFCTTRSHTKHVFFSDLLFNLPRDFSYYGGLFIF